MRYINNFDWDRTRWPMFTVYDCAIYRYRDMLQWLYSTIDNCEKHAKWTISESGYDVTFKFRYERDYTLFTLRWG